MSRIGPPMLYPQRYTWLVLVFALDIMLTWIILHRGGREVNPIAGFVIARFDIAGLVIFKFTILLFIILICEGIGRRRRQTGLRLVEWGIALTAIPVVWSMVLLAARR